MALIWMPLTSGAAENCPISVFVSIPPQKYFVERVGGDDVAVSVMVGPGHSPATYEPTPRQMTDLAKAQAYFPIGVPFEQAWMSRIMAANPQLRIVRTLGGISLRVMERPSGMPATHSATRLSDPHTWTSPPLVKVMAGHIRDGLIELEPACREKYRARYQSVAQDLDRLDAEIRKILGGVKRHEFMVFHPAWGYFADTYGLRQIPIESEGKQPGPKSLAWVIDEAKAKGIKVVFVQAQFSHTAADMIAREIGARVVAVDPLAENYMENMRTVASAFAAALVEN